MFILNYSTGYSFSNTLVIYIEGSYNFYVLIV